MATKHMVTQAHGQVVNFKEAQPCGCSAKFLHAVTKKQKLEIVERLEELRATTGLSERQFSKHCGLKTFSHYGTMITALRKGDGDNTSVARILSIADKMEVSLDWLLRGLGPPGIVDKPATDSLYPSRAVAIGVHQLMKTPEPVLAEILAVDDLDSDPGVQHWLDAIRVAADRYRRKAR